MQFREAPFGFFLVIERGDELLETITRFATITGVRAATFGGIGTVDRLTLGFYDLQTQSYERRSWEESLEVASLSGNIAVVDGGPFPHVHGVFCRRDFTAFGGHIFEAIVAINLELGVITSPEAIRRQPVDFCDLKLIEL